MPTVFTLEGSQRPGRRFQMSGRHLRSRRRRVRRHRLGLGTARKCRWALTRVFYGEPETKGCFPSRSAADDFADMLNPIPCRGEHCWMPVRSGLGRLGRLDDPGAPRDQKTVLKIAKKQGWEISRTKRGHYKLCPPDPAYRCVYASGTPSDVKAVRAMIAELRRSGLKI